jgi:hypothetical protein
MRSLPVMHTMLNRALRAHLLVISCHVSQAAALWLLLVVWFWALLRSL